MKVALVGPYPWPGDQISGGVERVIDTLMQHLTQHLDVTLIVPSARDDLRTVAHGVPVIYVRRAKGPVTLTYWTADSRKLACILDEVRPDIVHYQGVAGIARRIDHPGIITLHGLAHRDLMIKHSEGSKLKGALVRSMAELIKAVEQRYRHKIGNVVVINPYVLAALTDIASLRQFPIPNPLDRLFIEEHALSDTRPRRIISVGRIGRRKQTSLGVTIAAQVLAADPNASAAFFGTPERIEDLQTCYEIAAKYGVETRLIFPGNVTAERLRGELDAASVFLMTSQQETAPVAIAEAHSRGVAVLAPEAFGISHMIAPGENGFFLPEAPLDRQAALLHEALNYPWDRKAIAEDARNTYGPDVVAAKTLDAYRDILADYASIHTATKPCSE